MSVHPLHHLGGNRIFGREKGRSCGGDDVRTVLAEGLAGFLQRGGVDTVGIVRRFQRSRSDGSNHHDASNAAAAVWNRTENPQA